MPKKQSTAAKQARAAQAATGAKYTAALRQARTTSPPRALQGALLDAGFPQDAARLGRALAWGEEADRLSDIFGAADEQRWNGEEQGLPEAHLRVLRKASNAAGDALSDHVAGDYRREGREVVRAVTIALGAAATTSSLRALVPVAVAALPKARREEDFLSLSDAVRGHDRQAFPDPPRTFLDEPYAALAGRTAAALVEASRIALNGDEEWTECAALLKETYELAREAARAAATS